METQDLKTLRQQYQLTLNLSQLDLSVGDMQTKNSREGMKNKAKAELPRIKNQLMQAILKESTSIVALEDVNIDSQADEIGKNENVIVLDYYGLDKRLCLMTFPAPKGPYAFNSESSNRLKSYIADVGNELEAISMPVLNIPTSQFGVVTTRTEATAKITKALRDAYDNELSLIYLNHNLVNEIEKKVAFDKVVIIVKNVPQSASSYLAKNTGKAVMVTNLPVPNAIELDETTTASHLMESIAKALGAGKKKPVAKKTEQVQN